MEFVKKLAAFIYGRLEHITNNTTVRQDLKILYPMQDITAKQKAFEIEKLSLGILVFFAGVLFGSILIIKEGREETINQNRLQRTVPYHKRCKYRGIWISFDSDTGGNPAAHQRERWCDIHSPEI